MTKIGPLSRIHESSSGISMTSTPEPVAFWASAASAGSEATRVTGSNAAMALATAAYSRFASARTGPHSSGRQGQAISVRSCNAVSGGMR